MGILKEQFKDYKGIEAPDYPVNPDTYILKSCEFQYSDLQEMTTEELSMVIESETEDLLKHLRDYNSLTSIYTSVSKNGISQKTVERLLTYENFELPDTLPIESFTVNPSTTNLGITQEMLKTIIAAVLKFTFMQLVRLILAINVLISKWGSKVLNKKSKKILQDGIKETVDSAKQTINTVKDTIYDESDTDPAAEYQELAPPLLAKLKSTYNTILDYKMVTSDKGYSLENLLDLYHSYGEFIDDVIQIANDFRSVISSMIEAEAEEFDRFTELLTELKGQYSNPLLSIPYSRSAIVEFVSETIEIKGTQAVQDFLEDDKVTYLSGDSDAFWTGKWMMGKKEAVSLDLEDFSLFNRPEYQLPQKGVDVPIVSQQFIVDNGNLLISELERGERNANDRARSIRRLETTFLKLIDNVEKKLDTRRERWNEEPQYNEVGLVWPVKYGGVSAGSNKTPEFDEPTPYYTMSDFPSVLIGNDNLMTRAARSARLMEKLVADVAKPLQRFQYLLSDTLTYYLALAKDREEIFKLRNKK